MAQQQQASAKTTNGKPEVAAESTGVESLIGRLRDEGIGEGRSKGEALVADAEKQAADIVAKAGKDAEAILAKAQQDADKLKAGGEDAIKLAMRDTILAVEGDMLRQFADRLRRVVKGALEDPKVVEQMILAIAGKAAPKGDKAEVLLSSDLVTLEDLRQKPEEAKPGTLMHFVLSHGGGLLREGMSFGVADDGQAGIRVRVADEDLQIDVTEGAVTDLLLKHMLPRYRALLRGAVAAGSTAPEPPASKKKKG